MTNNAAINGLGRIGRGTEAGAGAAEARNRTIERLSRIDRIICSSRPREISARAVSTAIEPRTGACRFWATMHRAVVGSVAALAGIATLVVRRR